MKTPRALLAILFALAASVARAGESIPIFIPQSGGVGITDYSRPQNGADWTILRIVRLPEDLQTFRLAPRGTNTGDPITLVNPYDEYFIIPASALKSRSGNGTVLSISEKPYPGAMKGEPVRLAGPDGAPTGLQLWLPSHEPADIREQQRYWPTMPADNTRVERPRVILLPRDRSADNALQSGSLPFWFNVPGQKPRDLLGPLLSAPGQGSSLLNWPGQPATPPTYYTALTNYRYDSSKGKLIGPNGERAVTVLGGPSGSFFLAPPVVPRDFRVANLRLVTAGGETRKPEDGAQRPKSDGKKGEFKKAPFAGNWKDKITPIGAWHAVETAQPPIPMAAVTPMAFYCYHERMDGHQHISDHLKPTYEIIECVDWIVPKDDPTTQAEGKKFKTRNYRTVIDVVYKDGALRTVGTGANLVLKDKPLSWNAIGREGYVKVTAFKAPDAPAAASLALIAEVETRWLTRVQAAEYAAARPAAKDDAARKAVDDTYRALVEAQIRPEAQAAYKAARALPPAEAEAKIKEAIAKTEMWGGKDAKDIKAVIAPFQEAASQETAKMLEIQLSKEDYGLLEKNRPALLKYTQSRQQADGLSTQGSGFDPANVDPVALRLALTAARTAVGSAEGKPPVATTPEKDPRTILTPDEIALLTPEEKRLYEGFLERAKKDGKFDPTDNNLLTNAELLRNRMNTEKPPRSKAPAAPSSDSMTADQFAKLPLFQQRQFCKDYPPDPVGLGQDSRAPVIDNQADALKGAESSAAGTVTPKPKPKPAETPAKDTAWPRKARQDACAKLAPEIPGQIDGTAGTGGRSSVGTVVPNPGNGVDVENKEKEKSKWLTSDLLTSAAKGAMVGLLVGSLFGPVGLIAGPLLGGALFYGLTKVTS